MKKRIENLDLIRAVAILLVILCHSIEAIYSMGLIEWESLSIKSQFFRMTFFTLSRIGVPLFLFLSGCLLLNRNYENEKDVKNFYLKNFLNLFICVEIWNILYTIFLLIFPVRSWSIKEGVESLFFLKQVNLPNMWYMPMILGLYLFIPVLATVVKKFNFKYILLLMIPSIFIFFVLPYINKLTDIIYGIKINSILNLSFSGGIYGIYLILGFLIYNQKILKKISNKILILLLFVSFITTCIYQIILFKIKVNYNLWYDFVGILACSIVLFELLSRIKLNLTNKTKALITLISRISLAIFFIHIIIIKVLTYYFNFYIINKPLTVLLLCSITFILSCIIILIFQKCPFIKKRIFMIK